MFEILVCVVEFSDFMLCQYIYYKYRYVAMTRARKYLWIVGGSDYKKRVWWHQSTEHKYRGQIRKGKSPHSYPMLSPESSVRFIYDMELLAKRR